MSGVSSQLSADAACFIPSRPMAVPGVPEDLPASYTGNSIAWVPQHHQSVYYPVEATQNQLPNGIYDVQPTSNYEPWNRGGVSYRGRVRGRGYIRMPDAGGEVVSPGWPAMYSTMQPYPSHNMYPSSYIGTLPTACYTPVSYQSSSGATPFASHENSCPSVSVKPSAVLECAATDAAQMPAAETGSSVQATVDAEGGELVAVPPKSKKKKKKKKIMVMMDKPTELTVTNSDAITPVYRENSAQTDFEEALSRLTLSDCPNKLYKNTLPSDGQHATNADTALSAPCSVITSSADKRVARQNRSSSSGFPRIAESEISSDPVVGSHDINSSRQNVDGAHLDTSSSSLPGKMSWASVLKQPSNKNMTPNVQPSTDVAVGRQNRRSDNTAKCKSPVSVGGVRLAKSALSDGNIKPGSRSRVQTPSAGRSSVPKQDPPEQQTSSGKPPLQKAPTQSAAGLVSGETVAGRTKVRGKKKKNKKQEVNEQVKPDSAPLELPVPPPVDDDDEFPSLLSIHTESPLGPVVKLAARQSSMASAVTEMPSQCIVPSAVGTQSKTLQESTDGSRAKVEVSRPVRNESLNKASKTEQKHSTSGKRFNQPVAFSFAEAFNQQKQNVVNLRAKTAAAKHSKPVAGITSRSQDRAGVLKRVLTSNVVKKRGKEREVPKPKKPSSLRKIILKERESRREKFLNDMMSGSIDTSLMTRYLPAASRLCTADESLAEGVLDEGMIADKDAPTRKALLLSQIHSRRFREYCNQMLNKDIDNCCTTLLQELVRFQDRMFHKDPIKAKMKRRYVLGLREVTKHLKMHKLKCVIISPNLERVQSKGGLDEALYSIIAECQTQNVPFVFALSRKALGKACSRRVPVSVVGIFNYEAAEVHFNRLRDLTDQARQAYQDMVTAVDRELTCCLTESAADSDASAGAKAVFDGRSRSVSVHSTANSEPSRCIDLPFDVETAATRAYCSEGELYLSDRETDDVDDDDRDSDEQEIDSFDKWEDADCSHVPDLNADSGLSNELSFSATSTDDFCDVSRR